MTRAVLQCLPCLSHVSPTSDEGAREPPPAAAGDAAAGDGAAGDGAAGDGAAGDGAGPAVPSAPYPPLSADDVCALAESADGPVLGEGATGKVVLGLLHGKWVAVKWMPTPDDRTRGRAMAEAELLARLVHPTIVRFVAVHVEPDRLALVSEYAGHRCLVNYLVETEHRPSDAVRGSLLHDVADALQHLHRLGVAHMDVKGDNVLVSNDDVQPRARLCDFGHACVAAAEVAAWRWGTYRCAAPELVSCVACDARATDVWSFGVLGVSVAYGYFPFDAASMRCAAFVRFAALTSGGWRRACEALAEVYPHDNFETASDAERAVIDACLRVCPADRIDAPALAALLRRHLGR